MNKSLKKHEGHAMEKRPPQKQERKLKRSHRLKKHQSHLNSLVTKARKNRILKKHQGPRTIKGKKYLLYCEWKKKFFFDLQKISKNLTIKKKVKRVAFIRGSHEDHELLYVALYNTELYDLKRVLKMSNLDKKTKDLIKQALKKAYPFLTLCINHAPISLQQK